MSSIAVCTRNAARVATIAGLALAACGGGPAPGEPAAPAVVPSSTETGPVATSKTLNLYAWSEYIPPDLLDAFSREHGIDVNYDTYASNEELLAKMQAGASGYDVIVPSDYMVTVMAAQGMLEPLDLNRIPNFANIDPAFTNPAYDPGNRHTVPYQWGTVGIAVDTAAVDKPISAWADLWDPTLENSLVMVDDQREVIGLALMTLGFDRNTSDPAELEAAKAKLVELKPNIKLFDSDSPKTALLSGDVKAGVVWNGEAALAHRENAAIDYVLPAEGCGLWTDNLAIPKGAPHRDAALAFIDFALRPDMGMLISRDFPYSNPNRAALERMSTEDPGGYATYMGFSATNPPADALAKCRTIEDVGDALPLWDKVWLEVKGGE